MLSGSTSSASELVLPLDALVRAVCINRDVPHAFFLGAGASITSGMPSAQTCIWLWKRDLFLTNHPGLERQFEDASLPGVRSRIQGWLDMQGAYPPCNSEDEYGFYIERAYPIAQDRRQFFQRLVTAASPYVGYQLVALLANAHVVNTVWTVNFDALSVRTAISAGVTVIEIGLDTASRSFRPPRKGELVHVALHGDYRYDALKNTPVELQAQDSTLRQALVNSLRTTNLIVTGYSGRDHSIKEALAAAYASPGPGRLYWCGRDDGEPPPTVRELLDLARTHGREAFYVPTDGFDDLVARIALHCLEGGDRRRAEEIHSAALSHESMQPPFRVDDGPPGAVIKSNAFPITCPAEVLQFDADGFDGPGAWRQLREIVQGSAVSAGLFKGKVLAIGTVDGVREAFGSRIEGDVERSPIDERELSIVDGTVVRLLTEALTRSIAETRGLYSDGRDLLWQPQPNRQVTVAGQACQVHDAVLLALRRYAGQQFLVLKPTVKGTTAAGEHVPDAVDRELKRGILTTQYNRQFNDALNRWRERLFPDNANVFEAPPGAGSTFRFRVRLAPAFATVVAPPRAPTITIPASVERHIQFRGLRYPEPKLLFSTRDGKGIASDIHPLRGIVTNRPYDYPLTLQGIGRSTRLGVVCPPRDARRLSSYLGGLHRRAEPTSKPDYLLTYPGFAQAMGSPLDIPEPGDVGWVDGPEPDERLDVEQATIELARRIATAIEALHAGAAPNVTVVYVPDRWQPWERHETEDRRFDLHDFIKAFCVQRGIATQFLRESTITKEHQCEVLWWLALSFYAKAFRTPWVLANVDPGTAFMGLGFSVTPAGSPGRHIVLGCSHIYSAEGLGLRFRLSRVENPILRQGNPYMSREDARRIGENARQLFFESVDALPSRVVIHKRTPFLRDERDGLLEGLGEIANVDMLEIQIDDMLRYVASSISPTGQFQGDGFPIKRGTAVVLDHRRALLWTHGTTESLTPPRRYYQGRSRIPAPMLLIRHYGTSPLSSLGPELMGLTKMDWNTFDLYSRQPATIQSSNHIARIGALLQRSGPLSYDYRLFI